MTKYPDYKEDGDFTRQGDLDITFYRQMPNVAGSRFVAIEDKVIHEGEVTGHKHELKGGTAQVYVVRTDREVEQELAHRNAKLENLRLAPRWEEEIPIVIEVKEPTELVHPDHEGQMLKQGFYVITRQREHNEVGRPALVED